MPQLEQINTFTSQIFWLFAAFGVIYYFISRSAGPKITDVLKKRSGIISGDIEKAQQFKEESQQAIESLDKKLSYSRTEAFNIISSATDEANKLYADEIAKAELEIKKEYAAAEREILASKEACLADLRQSSSQYVEEILNKFVGLKVDRNTLEKALLQAA